MFLYLLSQSVRIDFDVYDRAVVAARSLADAAMIHPSGQHEWDARVGWVDEDGLVDHSWVRPDQLVPVCIGVAEDHVRRGVVCASYVAG